MRVYEGCVTWSNLGDAPIDEIEFLLQEAVDINDDRAAEANSMKSKSNSRGRRYR